MILFQAWKEIQFKNFHLHRALQKKMASTIFLHSNYYLIYICFLFVSSFLLRFIQQNNWVSCHSDIYNQLIFIKTLCGKNLYKIKEKVIFFFWVAFLLFFSWLDSVSYLQLFLFYLMDVKKERKKNENYHKRMKKNETQRSLFSYLFLFLFVHIESTAKDDDEQIRLTQLQNKKVLTVIIELSLSINIRSYSNVFKKKNDSLCSFCLLVVDLVGPHIHTHSFCKHKDDCVQFQNRIKYKRDKKKSKFACRSFIFNRSRPCFTQTTSKSMRKSCNAYPDMMNAIN